MGPISHPLPPAAVSPNSVPPPLSFSVLLLCPGPPSSVVNELPQPFPWKTCLSPEDLISRLLPTLWPSRGRCGSVFVYLHRQWLAPPGFGRASSKCLKSDMVPSSFPVDFLFGAGADSGCLCLLEPRAPKLVLLSLAHVWELGRAPSSGPLDLNHHLQPKQPCFSALS